MAKDTRTGVSRAALDPMESIVQQIEKMAGQKIPFPKNVEKLKGQDPFTKGGIGYSQFNELLLTLGYDRVSEAFFSYLIERTPHFFPLSIGSYEELSKGIEKFRKLSLLLYGNVKFGFKTLSQLDEAALEKILKITQSIKPEIYTSRHDPLHKIKTIAPEDAYYLGYIIERELKKSILADPKNAGLQAKENRMKEVRRIGRENHDAFLTYDHMDVYIATSMREPHEFFMVSGFVKELFRHDEIKPLKLRWFDPTLAYCEDRIDKGLVEGLMVKRAKCTIYHAQESDTLGKDSELAATLAQGKPVIAYVPKLTNQEKFKNEALGLAKRLYPDISVEQLIRKLFPLYYLQGAWKDPTIQAWLAGSQAFDVDKAFDLLFAKASEMYDARATTLRESHPLGLQVNIATGVANGVLVVRTVDDCAKLLRMVVLNSMEFTIEESPIGDRVTVLLRETTSGCVFRAMTGDELLTNSFWNFYLEDPQTAYPEN
jgi:hypothetical protein